MSRIHSPPCISDEAPREESMCVVTVPPLPPSRLSHSAARRTQKELDAAIATGWIGEGETQSVRVGSDGDRRQHIATRIRPRFRSTRGQPGCRATRMSASWRAVIPRQVSDFPPPPRISVRPAETAREDGLGPRFRGSRLRRTTCRSRSDFQDRSSRPECTTPKAARCLFFSFPVKAGGMRITQHKTPKEERETKPSKDVEESRPSSRWSRSRDHDSGVFSLRS